MKQWKRIVCGMVAALAAVTLLAGCTAKDSGGGGEAEATATPEPIVYEAESEVTIVE